MFAEKILTLDVRNLEKFVYATEEKLDVYIIGICKQISVKTKGNIFIQTCDPGCEVPGDFVCNKLFIDDFEICNIS